MALLSRTQYTNCWYAERCVEDLIQMGGMHKDYNIPPRKLALGRSAVFQNIFLRMLVQDIVQAKGLESVSKSPFANSPSKGYYLRKVTV